MVTNIMLAVLFSILALVNVVKRNRKEESFERTIQEYELSASQGELTQNDWDIMDEHIRNVTSRDVDFSPH
jgi:putative exporter of polyketide antibiotics